MGKLNNMKIFQIGFNRAGTSSFAYFFEKNGYKAAHWKKGSIAVAIETAKLEGKPLLSYIDQYDIYTDIEKRNMGHIRSELWRFRIFRRFLKINKTPLNELKPIYAFKYFKLLDKQYPGSKFILNTRDVDKWIQSRFTFNDNNKKIPYRSCSHGDNYHATKEELAECWREEWHAHHKDVLEYFADRPEDLLVFDIEKDGVEKIVSFFGELDLDESHWGQRNVSKK